MSSPSPPAELPLRRHQLVRVRPAAWQSLLQTRPELAGEPLLRDWAGRGWPLIARRRGPLDGEGVLLGLPLPPSAGKRRIAVEIQSGDLTSVSPLPSLADVQDAAPLAWQPSLQALTGLSQMYGVRGGVFGSLCWQWLTGLSYLSPHSDIDIAWTLPRFEFLDAFLDDLAAIDARAAMRLDGELVHADGRAANWRELYAGGSDLAVKTADRVLLGKRAAFIGATP